jgi:hypothetical protein
MTTSGTGQGEARAQAGKKARRAGEVPPVAGVARQGEEAPNASERRPEANEPAATRGDGSGPQLGQRADHPDGPDQPDRGLSGGARRSSSAAP